MAIQIIRNYFLDFLLYLAIFHIIASASSQQLEHAKLPIDLI